MCVASLCERGPGIELQHSGLTSDHQKQQPLTRAGTVSSLLATLAFQEADQEEADSAQGPAAGHVAPPPPPWDGDDDDDDDDERAGFVGAASERAGVCVKTARRFRQGKVETALRAPTIHAAKLSSCCPVACLARIGIDQQQQQSTSQPHTHSLTHHIARSTLPHPPSPPPAVRSLGPPWAPPMSAC
ncbi:hypothetical protein CERZMDRAFT_117181 [Cercospora zeae-maydis SCOH1-5]|uniref:Uncharacterized protein n=1 Tax=Cercospora zeae-maydis SCOH1-5 TaxID=717836 RepID=A0A6A6FLD9_9PEZI|nr:hypothetical protein CERZMDRAFT_117181 [Cercospora zeae-maydis SCOH1-5]